MIADRTARALARLLHRLRGDERGNVLMVIALALVPLTTATGMAIDYSRAMRLQTELEAVTDAASLSALTLPMMKKPIGDACITARHNFTSQIGAFEGMVLDPGNGQNLTITITDGYPDRPDQTMTCQAVAPAGTPTTAMPLSRKVTIAFAGQSTNIFGTLLGLQSLAVRGTTQTQTSLAPYVDIHLVLDTSQSMGLASTADGEKALWNATKAYNGEGCQFGCHVTTRKRVNQHSIDSTTLSNEGIANANNIELRVDVERKAALDMISTARLNQGSQQLYRFGIYRVGQTTTDIKALTYDLQSAYDTVSAVKLGPNTTAGDGDTNLNDVFTRMHSQITVHGNGVSAAQPRAFLFIVTDGVQDLCGSGHCVRILDPNWCQSLKNNNVTVGVIYTTYLPVKSDPTNPGSSGLRHEYTWLISPLPPTNIAPALRACATEGWFFEAADAPAIRTAMQKLFNQASQTPAIVR